MAAKYSKIYLPLALLAALIHVRSVEASACMGCLELDELTFDKILQKFTTVLVKFDIAYPYGDKHEAYAKLATEIQPSHGDFVVATVGIKDYGTKENSKLGERFNVGDKYPVIKLFRNGNANEWTDYPSDLNVTVENLRQFVRRHSNVYMALRGCLQKFDELASEFVRTAQSESIKSERIAEIVHIAEHEADQLEDEKDKLSGKVYILFMKRILENGLDFVDGEKKRLQQLLKGKISDNKKAELNQKLNILSAFNHDERRQQARTEL